jgi:hypothetical protein
VEQRVIDRRIAARGAIEDLLDGSPTITEHVEGVAARFLQNRTLSDSGWLCWPGALNRVKRITEQLVGSRNALHVRSHIAPFLVWR